MSLLNSNKLIRIRQICLGLTGMVCFAYAVAAVIGGTPQPFSPWLPGAMGLIAAGVISLSSFAAGRQNAEMAHDELYRAVNHRALRTAYWVALGLYPVFGILLALHMVDFRIAFAAMGTLTGAAYLLLFTLFDLVNG